MAGDPESTNEGWEPWPKEAPKHPWWDEKYNRETPRERRRLGEEFAERVSDLYEKLGQHDLTPRMVAAAFEDFKDDQKAVEPYYHDKVSLHDAWLAAVFLADEPRHMGIKRQDISDEMAMKMRDYDNVAALINDAMELIGERPPENAPSVG